MVASGRARTNVTVSPGRGRFSGASGSGASGSSGGATAILAMRCAGFRRSWLGGRTDPGARVTANMALLAEARYQNTFAANYAPLAQVNVRMPTTAALAGVKLGF